MRPTLRHALGVGFVVLVTAACNGVLGIPEVTRDAVTDATPGSEIECPSGKKACQTGCVDPEDPATGCGGTDCAPCGLANATSACTNGACAIAACNDGFKDCNGKASDGCEADTRVDNANCSACGTKCDALTCMDSVCRCTTNESCGRQGKCTEGNLCACDGDLCGDGEACIDGTCDGQ